MSSYLSRNAVTPFNPISEDSLYAIRWNDEDSVGEEVWCRVLIRSILREKNKAYVLCPDFGNSLLVKLSDLKDLPREFYDLPFQVSICVYATRTSIVISLVGSTLCTRNINFHKSQICCTLL